MLFDYMFTGDCPHCDGRRFEFGPIGAAARIRMMRCLNCRAEFLWTGGTWNVLSDNTAFPLDSDGARRDVRLQDVGPG